MCLRQAVALKSKHLKLFGIHDVSIIGEYFSTGNKLVMLRGGSSGLDTLWSCALSSKSFIGCFSINKVSYLNMKKSQHRKDKEEAYNKYDREGCHKESLFQFLKDILVSEWMSVCKHLLSVFKECIEYLKGLINGQAEGSHLRDQVHQENVMVSYSNAVVDPWAMVVISVNTCVADNAVSRSTCSNGFTLRTK